MVTQFYTTPEYDNCAERNAKLTKEIKEYSDFIARLTSPKRSSLSEQQKADLKAARNTYAKLEEARKILQAELASLPRPKLSSTWMKNQIIEGCDKVAEQFEKDKATFIERFSNNPEDAIEWLSEGITRSEEFMKYAYQIKRFAENHNYLETAEYLETLKAEITRSIFMSAGRTSHSTSLSDNMLETYKTAAWTRIIDRDFSEFLPMRNLQMVIYYAKEYEVVYDDQQPAK